MFRNFCVTCDAHGSTDAELQFPPDVWNVVLLTSHGFLPQLHGLLIGTQAFGDAISAMPSTADSHTKVNVPDPVPGFEVNKGKLAVPSLQTSVYCTTATTYDQFTDAVIVIGLQQKKPPSKTFGPTS